MTGIKMKPIILYNEYTLIIERYLQNNFNSLLQKCILEKEVQSNI